MVAITIFFFFLEHFSTFNDTGVIIPSGTLVGCLSADIWGIFASKGDFPHDCGTHRLFTTRHKSEQFPSLLLLHSECWRSSNDKSPKPGRETAGHCLTTQGSRHRPIHCVVITEKDIRGVALTQSSEEPAPSPALSPGAGNDSKGKIQRASGSETHQWPPCWPGVDTGRSRRGSRVHASLITPAETMSGNDA